MISVLTLSFKVMLRIFWIDSELIMKMIRQPNFRSMLVMYLWIISFKFMGILQSERRKHRAVRLSIGELAPRRISWLVLPVVWVLYRERAVFESQLTLTDLTWFTSWCTHYSIWCSENPYTFEEICKVLFCRFRCLAASPTKVLHTCLEEPCKSNSRENQLEHSV